MAVVGNAKELWQERSASFDGGIWTYSRAWLVQTDSKSDREDTVSGASGLPSYGAAHPAPISDNAYCTTINYGSFVSESPLAWKVTAGYTSERTRDETDPTADEVLVSWTSEIYQEAIFQDENGEAIVNSAGDYFLDPTPQRDAAHLIATIKANVSAIPAWSLSYQNAVNNAQISIDGLTIAQGLARLQRLNIGERKYRFGTKYYPVTFEVHVHLDGWRLKPLDAGFRERDSYGNLFQITNNGDDEEVTSPAPLNGSGEAIASPTPSNAVFLDFQIYQELDFSALPGIS